MLMRVAVIAWTTMVVRMVVRVVMRVTASCLRGGEIVDELDAHFGGDLSRA